MGATSLWMGMSRADRQESDQPDPQGFANVNRVSVMQRGLLCASYANF